MRDIVCGFEVKWEDILAYFQTLGRYDPVKHAELSQGQVFIDYLSSCRVGDIPSNNLPHLCCKPAIYFSNRYPCALTNA